MKNELEPERRKVMSLSPGEAKILSILQRHRRRLTTKELVEKFYKGEEAPEHAQIAVTGLVRSLSSKDKTVQKSKRRGPHPIEVWIE